MQDFTQRRPYVAPTDAGFTLVETLVAIAIVVLAVTAPLYTASRSIVAAQISTYQLTANALAQEAIEYVRLMRDNQYLKAYQVGGANVSINAWDAFKNNDPSDPWSIKRCVAPDLCTLDPTASQALVLCTNGCANQNLYITAAGEYTQSATNNTKTPFIRSVQATHIPGVSNDTKIVVTVSWTYRGNPYSIVASTHLTPWQ